jgi:Holliday junction resolvase RusA-like endonuclease
MKITIPGQPISQARNRYRKVGNSIWNYDPLAKKKSFVRAIIQEEIRNQEFTTSFDSDQSFIVTLTFYMAPPKYCSSSDLNAKLWGLVNNTNKPDLDNLEKFYLDCCNSLLFPDDKHIICLCSSKHYSHQPRTEINIMANKKHNLNQLDPMTIFSPAELTELIDTCYLIKCNIPGLMSEAQDNHFNLISQWLTQISEKYSHKFTKIKRHAQKKDQ